MLPRGAWEIRSVIDEGKKHNLQNMLAYLAPEYHSFYNDSSNKYAEKNAKWPFLFFEFIYGIPVQKRPLCRSGKKQDEVYLVKIDDRWRSCF